MVHGYKFFLDIRSIFGYSQSVSAKLGSYAIPLMWSTVDLTNNRSRLYLVGEPLVGEHLPRVDHDGEAEHDVPHDLGAIE